MMIFRDWSMWYIDNFMKMLQLNIQVSKVNSKKKEQKLMKNVKVFCTEVSKMTKIAKS